MKTKKWTPERFADEAMERIELARKHQEACYAAASFIRHRSHSKSAQPEWEGLRRALYDVELEEWRNLAMMGLVVNPKKRDRIKAAAHARFLREGIAVSHWWNDGINASSYYTADEEKFREMCRKAFSPKETKK